MLLDHHPFLNLLDYQNNQLKFTGQYFYDPLPEKCICTTSYIGSGQLSNPTTYQWSHHLGNIIETAIACQIAVS